MSTLNPLTVVPDEGCSPHLLNCHPVILGPVDFSRGFPGGSDGKEVTCQCRKNRFDPWVRKSPWRRKWQPTPVFLPGESHGRRSLVGSMGFSRQEYCSGLPFPSPGALPDPGIEPTFYALQADSFSTEPPGKPHMKR